MKCGSRELQVSRRSWTGTSARCSGICNRTEQKRRTSGASTELGPRTGTVQGPLDGPQRSLWFSCCSTSHLKLLDQEESPSYLLVLCSPAGLPLCRTAEVFLPPQGPEPLQGVWGGGLPLPAPRLQGSCEVDYLGMVAEPAAVEESEPLFICSFRTFRSRGQKQQGSERLTG